MRIRHYKTLTLITIFILFCIFYTHIAYSLPIPHHNDIYGHALIAKEVIIGQRSFLSIPFIMYFLSIILSGFSKDIYPIMGTIAILLAASTTLKFFITKNIINKITSNLIATLSSLSLLVVFAIPILFILSLSNRYYIGSFTPTVWHNSTIIFLMPFAILLFAQSTKQIESYSKKRDYLLTMLIFINIFIKPSFFIVFIVAYPLMMLVRYKFSSIFWKSLIPAIAGGVLLLIQYWFIYQSSGDINLGQGESNISIGFFTVFGIFVKLRFLPLIILFSFLFPILYFTFNLNKLKNNIICIYAILLIFFALAIYGGIYESGPRFTHGNLYWQIVPCAWILFFTSLIELLKDIKRDGLTVKNNILTTIYLFHVISGIYYIIRIITEHNYF